MVILVFFMVISVNRRLFRYFGSYSGISVIPVILVNRRTRGHSCSCLFIQAPCQLDFSGPTKDRKGLMPPKRTEKKFLASKRGFYLTHYCHEKYIK